MLSMSKHVNDFFNSLFTFDSDESVSTHGWSHRRLVFSEYFRL